MMLKKQIRCQVCNEKFLYGFKFLISYILNKKMQKQIQLPIAQTISHLLKIMTVNCTS